jgi:hypothetical protein
VKLVWFGSITDCEADMTAAISRHPDIDLTLYLLVDSLDQNNDYHRRMLTTAPNIKINEITTHDLIGICVHLAKQTQDLIVMRHPVWISHYSIIQELCQILNKQPLVVWTWEWLPNIAMKQMPVMSNWPRIATTNHQDFERCKAQFSNAQALYLPFGVVDRTEEELQFTEKYESDLVCDAQPHYECNEYNGIKRQSVDQMITPILDLPYKLSLWGSRYGNTTNCDWGATDKFKPFHRGDFFTPEYPKVYASSKIYLGVTWNWSTGGYSIRLARALGCGIATIWQDTVGCNLDIPEKGVVAWSKSPQETYDAVDFYMENEYEREQLAKRGKEWGVTNWEWGKQLKELASNIQ